MEDSKQSKAKWLYNNKHIPRSGWCNASNNTLQTIQIKIKATDSSESPPPPANVKRTHSSVLSLYLGQLTPLTQHVGLPDYDDSNDADDDSGGDDDDDDHHHYKLVTKLSYSIHKTLKSVY